MEYHSVFSYRKKWLSQIGKETKYLDYLVVNSWLSLFVKENFIFVSSIINSGVAIENLDGNEICLERVHNNLLEHIFIRFDRYSRPFFQVNIVQRNESNLVVIRAANLVKKITNILIFLGGEVFSRFFLEKLL